MNEITNELDWQAFRYVAGEMSAAELAEFEATLEHDQPARDAVVRAVELSQCVVLAESLVPSVAVAPVMIPANRDWSRSFTWFTVGVAACLCMMWSSQFIYSTRSAVSSELAEAWGSQLENMEAPAAISSLDEPLAENTESEIIYLNDAAPTWMVEAVRGLESTTENDDPAAEILES